MTDEITQAAFEVEASRLRAAVLEDGWQMDDVAETLFRMYRVGHTAGLERAAKVAMGITGPSNTPGNECGYSAACRDIAKTIRTLAHPPKEGQET